jgi:predicted N-acetyltransferase YhbS
MNQFANSIAAAPVAGEIFIRQEGARDILAREALLDRAFGPGRWRKTCERLREGRLPADGLAFTALRDGVVVGTLRFWSVEAGEGCDALMLGPIAVDESVRSLGLGGQMIRLGLERARALGHKAVILVGDAPYYQRFGFSRAGAEGLDMPGPVELARFLALELAPGALDGAQGLVRATGAFVESDEDRRFAA